VGAEQELVKAIGQAKREQAVALTKAQENLIVAQRDLDAAKDRATAMIAQKQAEAGVIDFENEASAAGWRRSVAAFQGNGHQFARYILYQKLAPGFRQIIANTAQDSPLMAIFRQFATSPSHDSRSDRPQPLSEPATADPDVIAAPSPRRAPTPAQNASP